MVLDQHPAGQQPADEACGDARHIDHGERVQDARAMVDEVGADVGVPDVLADGHADRDALDGHRLGQRTGREIALFVEHIRIGQFALEEGSDDLAVLCNNCAITGRSWIAT